MSRSSSITILAGGLAAVAAAGGAAAWLDALRVSHGAVPPLAWWETAGLAARGGWRLTIPAILTAAAAWLLSVLRADRSGARGRLAPSDPAALSLGVAAGWTAALVVLGLAGFSTKVGWIAGALLAGLLAWRVALRVLSRRGAPSGGPARGLRFAVVAAVAAAILWGAMWIRPEALGREGPAGPGDGIGGRGSGGRAADRPSVLLIVIDALRADHLGVYGYRRPTSPHIDRLAAGGVVFTEAVSPSSWTLPAMASLFSSAQPGQHGAIERGDPLEGGREVLAETLRAAGYRTAAFAPNPWLKRSSGFDRGFGEYYDLDRLGLARRLIGVRLKNLALRRLGRIRIDPELVAPAEDLTSRALRWMRRHGDGPFFLLLHYMDVHSPYLPPAPYRGRFCAGHEFDLPDHRLESRFRAGKLEADPRILEHVIELYDEGILAADASVGRLVAGMEAIGVAGRTAVILTADHGEEFQEHGGTMHGKTLYQEVIRVPLVIRPPLPFGGGSPREPRVVSERVTLLDLHPTILDLAGLPLPGPVEGISLAAGLGGKAAASRETAIGAQLYHDGSAWDALLAGEEKIIRVRALDARRPGETRLELYDLRGDPGERDNLAASHEERVADLLAILAGYEETWGVPGSDRGDAVDRIDPETLEQLKALGYVH